MLVVNSTHLHELLPLERWFYCMFCTHQCPQQPMRDAGLDTQQQERKLRGPNGNKKQMHANATKLRAQFDKATAELKQQTR